MSDADPDPERDVHDQDLINALDSNRAVVELKLAGLSLEQATAVVTPSGVTLLGIVTHLTAVERNWFETSSWASRLAASTLTSRSASGPPPTSRTS